MEDDKHLKMKGIIVIFMIIMLLAAVQTGIIQTVDPYKVPLIRPFPGYYDVSRLHPVIQTAFQRYNSPAPVSLAW